MRRSAQFTYFFAVEIFHIFPLAFSLSLFMMIIQSVCPYPSGFLFHQPFFPHCVYLMRNAPKWGTLIKMCISLRGWNTDKVESFRKNIFHTHTQTFFRGRTHLIIPSKTRFYYCMTIIYLIMPSKKCYD